MGQAHSVLCYIPVINHFLRRGMNNFKTHRDHTNPCPKGPEEALKDLAAVESRVLYALVSTEHLTSCLENCFSWSQVPYKDACLCPEASTSD